LIYETERLVVRAWTTDPGDVARLADLYAQPELTRVLGPLKGRPDEVPVRWQAAMDGDPRIVLGAMQIRATGVVAGTILFKLLPDDTRFEVGWHQHPDSWGHGYVTEAARGVLARAFAGGVPEVWAVVRPDNVRSIAVCRGLGMRPVGRTTRYYQQELELFHLPGPG
jgi:RimJ/RimL family protein N-acetyltransferase